MWSWPRQLAVGQDVAAWQKSVDLSVAVLPSTLHVLQGAAAEYRLGFHLAIPTLLTEPLRWLFIRAAFSRARRLKNLRPAGRNRDTRQTREVGPPDSRSGLFHKFLRKQESQTTLSTDTAMAALGRVQQH